MTVYLGDRQARGGGSPMPIAYICLRRGRRSHRLAYVIKLSQFQAVYLFGKFKFFNDFQALKNAN